MNKVSGVLMLLIYIFVATALLASENFVQPYNLQNILRWTSYFAIIGIGAAIVIIAGGIDLSIGSVIALAGCSLPMMIVQWQWPVAAALAVAMGIALLIGLYNGLNITKAKLPPFIVTLCGLMICRGLARWLTGDQTQGFGSAYDDSFRLLATGKPCSFALIVMLAGGIATIWFSVSWIRGRNLPDFARQQATSLCGLAGGILLAIIGSSRFWQGYKITTGGDIDLLFGWKMTTWKAVVPESAARLPGELMWWCGLAAIPASVWFAMVAIRGGKAFLKPLITQIVAVVVLLPLALHGCGDWFSLDEKWIERWRMTEVFVSLGLLMGCIGWFLKSGLRAGQEAARIPLIVLVGTAIMWLVGRSYFLREHLEASEFNEAWLTLVGKTRLMEILVPMPFLIMLLLAITVSIFLNATIYGRYLFALGRNEQAARYSGINTDAMIILAYLLCGAVTGLAAILFTLEINAVQPSNHGNTYELYAIAAAVLGGCSLKGGEGSILGVVLGAAVMYLLRNAISLLGIPSPLEYTIIGGVILAGVMVDEMVKRVAARRRRSLDAAE
jgi:ribose/xylose/arabinose/galactoside ABC-type transport system permease subunit